jgi:hypothetical protein
LLSTLIFGSKGGRLNIPLIRSILIGTHNIAEEDGIFGGDLGGSPVVVFCFREDLSGSTLACFLGKPTAMVSFVSQECRQPDNTVVGVASSGDIIVKLLL